MWEIQLIVCVVMSLVTVRRPFSCSPDSHSIYGTFVSPLWPVSDRLPDFAKNNTPLPLLSSYRIELVFFGPPPGVCIEQLDQITQLIALSSLQYNTWDLLKGRVHWVELSTSEECPRRASSPRERPHRCGRPPLTKDHHYYGRTESVKDHFWLELCSVKYIY